MPALRVKHDAEAMPSDSQKLKSKSVHYDCLCAALKRARSCAMVHIRDRS